MRRVDGVFVVLAVQGSLFFKQDIIASVIDTLKKITQFLVKPLHLVLQCARPPIHLALQCARPLILRICASLALPATAESSDCARTAVHCRGQGLDAEAEPRGDVGGEALREPRCKT